MRFLDILSRIPLDEVTRPVHTITRRCTATLAIIIVIKPPTAVSYSARWAKEREKGNGARYEDEAVRLRSLDLHVKKNGGGRLVGQFAVNVGHTGARACARAHTHRTEIRIINMAEVKSYIHLASLRLTLP